MDHADDRQWETQLATAMLSAWQPLASQWPPDRDTIGTAVAYAAQPVLEETHRRVIIALLLWMMQEDARNAARAQQLVDAVKGGERARELSRMQAQRLARDFSDVTLEWVNRQWPPGAEPPTLDEYIAWGEEHLWWPGRAERIGITETTTAISIGEAVAAELIAEAGGLIEPFWQTAEDEDVCPVCNPLNGEGEEIYGRDFPLGPPAHVRCRCRKRWRMVQPMQ